MYNIVGHCPKCGAPIYSPSVWHSITPPPVVYTCSCIPVVSNMVSTSSINLSMAIDEQIKTQKKIFHFCKRKKK